MSFGEPNPCSVDKANGFMVEQGKKTPSMWNRVKYGVGAVLFDIMAFLEHARAFLRPGHSNKVGCFV